MVEPLISVVVFFGLAVLFTHGAANWLEMWSMFVFGINVGTAVLRVIWVAMQRARD